MLDAKTDLHRKKRKALEGLVKTLPHTLMTGESDANDLNLGALGAATEEVA